MFHLKKILKRYVITKLDKNIVKFGAEKILSTFVSCTKRPFEGQKISCTKLVP